MLAEKLKKMLEILETEDLNWTNEYGETNLHLACRKGNADNVQTLIEKGANIESCDCEDNTPLFHAVLNNQLHIVQILITANCDLDVLNSELMTPLDEALLYNYSDIVTALLKAGCNINKPTGQVFFQDHYSNSVISSLWTNGDLHSIQILRDCGYKILYSDLTRILQDVFKDSDDHTRSEKGGGISIISDLMSKPTSLKNLCRITLRRYLKDLKMIKNKPLRHLIDDIVELPLQLKEYIKVDSN